MNLQTLLNISLVIPTYNREQILIDTISYLLQEIQTLDNFQEFLIIDQTSRHEKSVESQLQSWHDQGLIKWIRLVEPNLTKAMNLGLTQATGDIVLFTDDDIIPAPNFIKNHLNAHRSHPEVTAVVGQVLQPGESPEYLPYQPRGNTLFRYLDFPFRSTHSCFVENVMAGNLSVKRQQVLAIGGFDEAFSPPVASRFETEFAKRVIANHGKIWFEPTASIHHLQAKSGGTRSQGSHLNSASPIYGVGDYYYALRQGRGWERVWYILRKPFREIRTKYHLTHPWWIIPKLIGEMRAFSQACQLANKSPQLPK